MEIGEPVKVRVLRRLVVTVVGFLLVALGIALVPLPGPGLLVAVGGLALLSTEYVWAQRLVDRTRKRAEQGQRAAVSNMSRTVLTILFALGLVGAGVLAFAEPDLPLASPAAGIGLVLGGVVLLVTTVVTYRHARGQLSDDGGLSNGTGSTRAHGPAR